MSAAIRLTRFAAFRLYAGALWTRNGEVERIAYLLSGRRNTRFHPGSAAPPVAARAGFGNVHNDPDLISSKLPALHFYQLSIPAPKPPEASFDHDAASRGKELFEKQALCATCHVAPTYTEPGWNMHTPQEIAVDDFQANRAPDKQYRTSPLKGLWTHQARGFYHDGRFATLLAVVDHYDAQFNLHLTVQEKGDLAEYLKSL